jgi:hypothetical protein
MLVQGFCVCEDVMSLRVGAAFAWLGLLWWAILAPFMATIGICESKKCFVWHDKPLVVRTVGQWLAQRGWFDGAVGDNLYFGYGRWFFVVYLCVALAVWAFWRRKTPAGRLARAGFWLLFASLIISALGDFASYGVGGMGAWIGADYAKLAWSWGFGVEVIAWLGIVLSSLLLGIACWRVLPRWLAMTIILGGLLMPVLLLDFWFMNYAPNTQTMPLVLAWAVIGGWMWRKK